MIKARELIWFRLIALATVALGMPAHAEDGITKDRILIGQAAGFTGSVAGAVKEQKAGAMAYIDGVNANGGVHGRKIVLESMDDGFDAKKTPEVTRQLIEDKKVFALFLFRGTPNTEASYPVAAKAKVPLIAPSTGAQSMYSPPRKYLFPVRASYHSETTAIVNHLVSLGIKKIAVFHDDGSFGLDVLAGVQNALKERKMTPSSVASYPRGTLKIEPAVKTIATDDPQAVIMAAAVDSGPAFIAQMKAQSKNPMFFTLSNLSANSFVKALGTNVNGVVISQVSPYPFAVTTPISSEFLKAIKGKDMVPSYASIEGFIAAKVLVEGLRRAGPQPTREKLIKGLESMARVDLGGISVHYGPEDRSGTTFVDLTVLGKDGQFFH
jgi:ABC-type branched-subunit amino acid transport system substrate-binding protein